MCSGRRRFCARSGIREPKPTSWFLYTPGVGEEDLAALAEFGPRLGRCERLPTSESFNARHERGRIHKAAPFTKGGKPVFHTPLDNFVKLRLWQLEEL